jgi:hypothetical protein
MYVTAIVFSVLFMASDYPFGIFNLFIEQIGLERIHNLSCVVNRQQSLTHSQPAKQNLN